MPDMPDLPVHDQAVRNGKGIPVLQVVQHNILVMDGKRFFLILGMHIFADASSALGKKVIPGCGDVQLFILICRRNFTVGVILCIDVVQRIILFRKA